MEKYYVGDDTGRDEDTYLDTPPVSAEDLRERVQKMVIFAEVENRGKQALVRVLDNTGTHHFMSTAATDYTYLRQHSYKTEKRGMATFYYFKF